MIPLYYGSGNLVNYGSGSTKAKSYGSYGSGSATLLRTVRPTRVGRYVGTWRNKRGLNKVSPRTSLLHNRYGTKHRFLWVKMCRRSTVEDDIFFCSSYVPDLPEYGMLFFCNPGSDLFFFVSICQCCGSWVFIPDPNFSIPDPGSKRFWIPDPNPHQRI